MRTALNNNEYRYEGCTLTGKDILLEYYKKGYTIDSIGGFMGISRDEVLEYLNKYRLTQRVSGQYSDELMQLVAKRDSYDFRRKDIMSELGISRNFLAKSIEEYGFLNKTTKESGEELFMEVSSDFKLDKCPKCESHKVNGVETINDNSPTKGYYCLDCGSEFSIREGKLYVTKWENID